jgi:hypothetical protein
VHQVDTFRARAEYTQARQLKEEEVGPWHTRILQLHTRAWHGAVDREMSHELIYKLCHQVGHLAGNCPKGSAPATGTTTAKKSFNFTKKKKSGGDQKGQKPRTNTGSYGPVQKARLNALGESETCDGQLYGEGN